MDNIRKVVNLKRTYHIPYYQRGYKWTVAEVCKLLSDIYAFEEKKGEYCLQNITLLKKNGVFNVIDGQQRLTTVLIILAYLQNENIDTPLETPNLNIEYGIRENTNNFITKEILTGEIWNSVPTAKDESWNQIWLAPFAEENARYEHFQEMLRNRDKQKCDHQDIYHIFSAAMAIEAWFSHTGENKRQFKSKFLDRVIFIINEITDEDQEANDAYEAKIFSKINGFRIPLDGADLLRGIFITEVAREQLGKDDSVKYVQLNELRVKIGLELDSINTWWSAPERKQYFKFFSSVTDPDNVFNSAKYPINQLYKLYVETLGRTTITIDDFEKGSLGISADSNPENKFENIFSGIRNLHRTMQDWYEDRQIYHYMGFILAQLKGCSFYKEKQTPFAVLWDLWNDHVQSPRRSDFIQSLKKIISDGIFSDSQNVNEALWIRRIKGEEVFDWYNTPKLYPFLILLDVLAYADPAQDSSEGNMHLGKRMNAEFFENYKGTEDKEHIFPQTPIADYDLRGQKKTIEEISGHLQKYWELICQTAEQSSDALLKEWNEFWREKSEPDIENFPIDHLTPAWYEYLKDADKRDIVQRIINEFILKKCEINLNSIGNIVLLRYQTNRSYGNNFYTLKRKQILQDYRSHLSIRFHTRAVFAKEFLETDDSVESFDCWGKRSILQNTDYIVRTLLKFFPLRDNN